MTKLHGAGVASILGMLIAVGCGSSEESNFPGESSSGASGGTSSSGDPGGSSSGFASSSGTTGGGSSGAPCVGLQCQQVACAGGGSTTLTGKVLAPTTAEDLPIYNAVVYVPNAPVEPFKDGVVCDRCGTTPSGKPVTTAITDAKGNFTLKNVPVGKDIPVVIQLGRWRKQFVVPNVAQCTDTPLDATQTRLPKNKSEGEIPHIALTTGGADTLECFLRKLGFDDSEFTNPDKDGRIHLYQGTSGSKIDGQTPNATTLWNDLGQLKKYDIVVLSCEGDEYNNTKSDAARQAVHDYLDSGGRVFSSHFHYTWLKNGKGMLPSTATWVNNGNAGDAVADIDTSFPKGAAFAEWLVEAKASTTMAKVPMTALRRNVTSVPGVGGNAETSRRWISVKNGANDDPKFYSFNTPIGKPADQQCGRGVYTDIHVSSADTPGGTFPTSTCKAPGLIPQEKALLFLLTDLASCVQDETQPPQPPPPVKGPN